MGMVVAVLSGFVLALAAPYLYRITGRAAGWIFAVLPAGLAVYFATHIGAIEAGQTVSVTYEWVPALGISLSFYLDGLSLLFALLIAGIGALIVIYSGGYLEGHPQLGLFFAFILTFMGSMLGLVMADNAITLFVFWELTSLSSYFLIGFDHEREIARSSALQALLVTGLGGLALLAGLLLLGQVDGGLEISAWLGQGGTVQSHALYPLILLLVLCGAFTKSAQAPFHFWLPSAMEAPTPVSAYLHSATMVNAGIYLLARLNPILGGTHLWIYAVTVTGGITMLMGAMQALQQTDMKRILAYSTVSVLGTLTLLLGLGSEQAIKAAMVLLLAHALYKAAMFLVAGAVDHGTGVRDINRLSGLRHAMPMVALAASVAALSMAGLPPLFGFIGKEMLYQAALETQPTRLLLIAVAVLTSMLLVAVAWIVGVRPFIGEKITTPKDPHDPPVSLWIGPGLLAGLGLLFGLLPDLLERSILSPSVEAVLGRPSAMDLALWHGLNPGLALSAVTFAGGAGIYAGRNVLLATASRVATVTRWGPAAWYDVTLIGLNRVALAQTRLLQSGYLRVYLLTVVGIIAVLGGYTLIRGAQVVGPAAGFDIRFYELVLAVIMLLGAVVTARARSVLHSVVALGAVGYCVALIFVLFGAPDLGMTQFLIETLMVLLFVIVFYRMPRFKRLSSTGVRLRDVFVATLAGGLITALVLRATAVQWYPSVSTYFAEHSYPLAHGRNIVNVILVDFRALDTLGEITVLAVAGAGVYALLKLRPQKKED
jgi:multicomponent Na+:H+ antiporter subunit A